MTNPSHLPHGVANTPAAIRGDIRKTLAKADQVDAKKDHFTPVFGDAHSKISIGKAKHTTGTKITASPMTNGRHSVHITGLKKPEAAATALRDRGYQIPANATTFSGILFTTGPG